MTTIDTTSVLPDSAQPVVFLGPTMPLADARRLLPRARFAPPVRCGDLLALLRLPSGPVSGALQVAIIDGCFENVAAVWHKEILWALRGGARIWGAASMGALRAAELCDLGMVGVGAIFDGYRRGELVDDAEVAVLHGPAAAGYRVITDAMVNIRATLAQAVTDGVLDPGRAERLQRESAAVFYQRRVFSDVVDEQGESDPGLAPFAAWLQRRGGLIDQKRQDAELLLRRLADADDKGVAARVEPPTSGAGSADGASDTVYLRTLECYHACRPFPFYADWLPAEEKLGRAARLLGPRYQLARQLALALALLDACARACGRTLQAELRRGLREQPAAVQRLGEDLLRFYGVYPPRPEIASRVMPIMAPLASAWWALQEHLVAAGGAAFPPSEQVLAYARRKQVSWGLSTQPLLDAWRQQMGLVDGRAHVAFWQSALQLETRLTSYAIGHYGCFRVDGRRAWLIDALRMSGLYDELDRQLGVGGSASTRADFVRTQRQAWTQLGPMADAHAVECDFDSAADLEAELVRITATAPSC